MGLHVSLSTAKAHSSDLCAGFESQLYTSCSTAASVTVLLHSHGMGTAVSPQLCCVAPD